MLSKLTETINELNSGVKNVANCEKAKKLRKKLLSIGLPLVIIGLLGIITCILLATLSGVKGANGSPAFMIIPLVAIFPCGIIVSIGGIITSFGFNIIITGKTANLIDEATGSNCSNCGEPITSEMLFCPKCGTGVKKACPNCKHVNKYKNEYCEKCGTKLD